MKEALMAWGYNPEDKKIPDIQIFKLSDAAYREALIRTGRLVRSVATSIPDGLFSRIIFINQEVIPEDLIPFIEIHEIVESIEADNDVPRLEAHKIAIWYEYCNAQRAGLLEEEHAFITGWLKESIAHNDLPLEIIEEQKRGLRIRQKIFELMERK